jgi:hypothetical protein
LLRNFVPSSTGVVSVAVIRVGREVVFHREHGQLVVEGTSETDAVFETPLNVAVTTAVCADVMVPAVIWKVALEAEVATATEAGVVSKVLLSVTAMDRVCIAIELRATVQTAAALEATDVGEHTSDVSDEGSVKLIETVFDVPLDAALTDAV